MQYKYSLVAMPPHARDRAWIEWVWVGGECAGQCLSDRHRSAEVPRLGFPNERDDCSWGEERGFGKGMICQLATTVHGI